MKVAVLGATGRTGSLIVLSHLEAGDHVTALVRDPAKATAGLGRELTATEAARLTIVKGLPTIVEDVKRVVAGADVVYETLGPALNTPGVTLKRDTAAALIEAMRDTGVTRLVTLGSEGTNPKSLEGLSWKLRWIQVNFVRGFLLDHIYHDLALANDMLKKQGDWLRYTIVQPPLLVLTKGPTGKIVMTTRLLPPGIAHALPYADLAAGMVQIGKSESYIREEVLIDCTAPPSEIVAVEGAFFQQKEVLWDNIKRKTVPKMVLLAAIGVGTVAILHRQKIGTMLQSLKS